MDVLSLLKKDHRTVDGMLNKAIKCEPEDDMLRELATQIEEALTVHAALEEKYFYPLLRKRSEETEETVDVFEAYTEHDLLKRLVALLQSGRQPDEKFKAEVQVLTETVKHHVKEEESTIFSLARKLMSNEELDDMGQKVQKAKDRLMAAGVPRKAPAHKTARR